MTPGELVADRFRLIEPLAAGGMGTVWRARHIELDVDVAVKLMSAEIVAAAGAEKRFRREARAAARLRSPHIVQVLDYGAHQGQPYLVMELLKGEDLGTRLAERGTLDFAGCAKVVDAVAKALQLAHAQSIIHRDLKPENIFIETVGDDEVVKVVDFGIAKELGVAHDHDRTTGGGIVGSPAYMSPEQVLGEPIDLRTDLWSLGVVVWEMLLGEPPFDGPTVGQVFRRITGDQPPRASDHAPQLPRAIDAFFARALARDPEERFSSAREMADAFHQAVAGEPAGEAARASAPAEAAHAGAGPSDTAATLVRQSGATPRDPRSSTFDAGVSDSGSHGRNRRGLTLAALVVVCAFVAVFWLGRGDRDERPSTDPEPVTSGAPSIERVAPPSTPHPATSTPTPAANAPAPNAPAPNAPANSAPAPSVASSVSPPRHAAVVPPPRQPSAAPIAIPAPPSKPSPSKRPDPQFGVPVPVP